MTDRDRWLAMSDAELLAQCEMDTYRSSGPGGQHRNKVSSAVRVRHGASGLSAHGDDSRSQGQNKALALARLRMALACQIRQAFNRTGPVPVAVAECIFTPKNAGPQSLRRIAVGRKDHRFWPVAAALLDLLATFEGRLADAATILGVTTSNFANILQSDRHLLAVAQQIRKTHGLSPIK